MKRLEKLLFEIYGHPVRELTIAFALTMTTVVGTLTAANALII